MKRTTIFTILLISISWSAFCQIEKEPLRKKRSESFFGLHFDFHATETDKNMGRTLSAAMVDSLLVMVKPDFIQVDCKGHPGISSYPTKVGNSGNSFDKDPLKIFREATAKRGVALYVHYSGVRDYKASAMHPEWMRVDENGNKDKEGTSLFSPYAEQLLIPQINEISKEYNVDGIWVDGDNWAVGRDYSENAIKAYKAETGLETVPKKPSDPNYIEFTEFHRMAFKKYLQAYVNNAHKNNPKLQIASNWAYSSRMPEKVEISVDFASGDLTPQNSVNSAALEARCLALQGLPWDLMSWGFVWDWRSPTIFATKSALQLKQEAAEVISMGGGYQAYFQQNKDASLQPWTFPVMQSLASFCRERQAYCFKTKAVPQIALWYSTESYKRNSGAVYISDTELNSMEGILTSLLDGQQAVEILMDHHLKGNMKRYPIIVIPESKYISESWKTDFIEYVQSGGNLLIIGAEAVKPFEKELGVAFEGKPNVKAQYLGYKDFFSGINSNNQAFKLLENTMPFGSLSELQDFRFDKVAAGSIKKLGKGKIAAIYFDMGDSYKKNQTPTYRNFINGMVSELFTNPIVKVKGSHLVHVTVNKQDQQLLVNLINTSGPHANKSIYAFDEIPTLSNLEVSVNSGNKPLKVVMQPGNQVLKYNYAKGIIKFKINELKIHNTIVIE